MFVFVFVFVYVFVFVLVFVFVFPCKTLLARAVYRSSPHQGISLDPAQLWRATFIGWLALWLPLRHHYDDDDDDGDDDDGGGGGGGDGW